MLRTQGGGAQRGGSEARAAQGIGAQQILGSESHKCMEQTAEDGGSCFVCKEHSARLAVVLESCNVCPELPDLSEGVREHLNTSVTRVLELDVEQRVLTVQESLKATDQFALCGATQCYLPLNYVLEVAPTRTRLCPKFFPSC